MKNNTKQKESLDEKLDNFSKKAEPYVRIAIWVSLLAVILIPLLIYLYSKYKSLLTNPYLIIGALLLLIPILLEVLLSLGIQKKAFKGLIFAIIYCVVIAVLGYKNWIPGILVILGYLISYLVVSSFIGINSYFNKKFKEVNSKLELAKATIIPLLDSWIPILLAIALKYLTK